MEIHRYHLALRGAANARTGKTLQGALVRDSRGGHACLQSWPSLGEASLDELLRLWSEGEREHPILKQLATCLQVDGEARAAGVSLFDTIESPESYFSTPPNLNEDELEEAHNKGFRAAKCKAGGSLDELTKRLLRLSEQAPDWDWRVDFNGFYTVSQLTAWWVALPGKIKERIVYLEDPGRNGESWAPLRRAGATCAIDRCLCSDASLRDIRIVKPAVQDWRELPEDSTLVFTSNMQHPFGQIFDAYEAARAKQAGRKIGLCGLVTQHLYSGEIGTQWLGNAAPKLPVQTTPGFGFDGLLKKLSWSILR